MVRNRAKNVTHDYLFIRSIHYTGFFVNKKNSPLLKTKISNGLFSYLKSRNLFIHSRLFGFGGNIKELGKKISL